MKKPFLDTFERRVIREAPDSYSAARYRFHFALKNLERELSKTWFIRKIEAFLRYTARGL